MTDRLTQLRRALIWYEEHAAGAKLSRKLAKPYLEALKDDAGERAREALRGWKEPAI